MPKRTIGFGKALSYAAFMVTTITGAALAAPPVPPVVPGYEQLVAGKFSDQAALGELLIGELNCTSCHAAPQGNKHIVNKPAPDLSNVGARVTTQYLLKFLADPHGTKPGTTMPSLTHAFDADTADALLHYLISQGGPIAPSNAAADSATVEAGRKLFHTVGCVACHSPEVAIDSKIPAVPLPNLAMKTTVEALSAFLLDPLKVRPGGRMPSLHLTTDEARAIAIYLLRDQMNNPQSKNAPPVRAKGLLYSHYKGSWDNIPDFAALKPVEAGVAAVITSNLPTVAKDEANFGLRFTGHIAIPKTGEWTFTTKSDDGSKLSIDGKLIVNNDGIHPPTEQSGKVTLSEGPHAITVDFHQGGAGHELTAYWEGPEMKREEIPASALSNEPLSPMVPLESEAKAFAVDAAKAEKGRAAFVSLGCAACHAPGTSAVAGVKPLAGLNPDAAEGCLGDHIKKDVPNYDLSPAQRDAIKAALKNANQFATALEPKAAALAAVARLNCLACHVRDGLGGPDTAHNALFKMTAEVDLGDEGRLPPKLTGVGAKLKPAALSRIVNLGELHVRPTLATRMPSFGVTNTAALLEALPIADGAKDTADFKATKAQVKDGHTLAGVKGLGCITCHSIRGTKSLGMPGIDLGTAFERVRPEWFHAWLTNPQAMNPGTRMPMFFDAGKSPVKTIAGGDAAAQITSLYAYLSQGKAMQLPEGMAPTSTNEYELIPGPDPIVHRTYFEGFDRAILAGFPEMVHVAFDQGVPRMAKAWRGKFFDAAGMWKDRGGHHNGPLGTDIIEFPAGPALAVLEKADTPWPTQKDRWDRNIGGKFHGYRLDKDRRPIFLYQLGDTQIEEQPLPVVGVGSAELERKFTLTGEAKNLYLIAGGGVNIESIGSGVYKIDGKMTVKITGDAGEIQVRKSNNRSEILVPVQFKNGAANVEVEYTW